MRVTFFGTGAMASLFAARFALAGVAEVTMIGTWAEAIHAIRKKGICIEDISGIHSVDVVASFPDESAHPADLAVVLVKSWQTPRIAACLEKNLKSDGVAISLQNGLGNIEAFGGRVSPGITSEGATLLDPGVVAHRGAGVTHTVAPDTVVEIGRAHV